VTVISQVRIHIKLCWRPAFQAWLAACAWSKKRHENSGHLVGWSDWFGTIHVHVHVDVIKHVSHHKRQTLCCLVVFDCVGARRPAALPESERAPRTRKCFDILSSIACFSLVCVCQLIRKSYRHRTFTRSYCYCPKKTIHSCYCIDIIILFAWKFGNMPGWHVTRIGTNVTHVNLQWANRGLVTWCSGNAFHSINEVTVLRARLILRWVTACGQVNHLEM